MKIFKTAPLGVARRLPKGPGSHPAMLAYAADQVGSAAFLPLYDPFPESALLLFVFCLKLIRTSSIFISAVL